MLISFYVFSFYTKYPDGFLQHEIDELIKCFPAISEEGFLYVLSDNTCILINDQVVIRKNDIERALFSYFKLIN